MNSDSQTWAALAVVALTAGIFAWRAMRGKKRSGCGGGCGCAQSRPVRR